MSRFSILLIENQISVTAQIVEVIGQNLADYTLTITKNFAEITTEPERPHVILLDVALLSNDVPDQWTMLTTAYPDIPIKLLVPQPPLDSTSEVKLMDALRRGANSYYDVSEPGLLSLGRSLATLQHSQSGQSVNLSNPPSIGDLLVQAISRDTSQLAIQIFDLKGRVKAWSQAAELLFQIKPENAIGHLIDELPLATDNLSRLKDMLDQVQATSQTFFIPFFHLVNQQSNTEQTVHVQVYPIYESFSGQSKLFNDICIIITSLPDVRHPTDTQGLRHNEELQILLEASRKISGQLELMPTLEKVIEQTRLLLYGQNCQIYFLEKDNKTLRPVLTDGPLSDQIESIPLIMGQGVLGKIAAGGKAALISTIKPDIEIPYPQDEQLLCAPLTVLGGTIGLVIVSRRAAPFSQDDLYFFETLVQQASSAINNARLFEETERNLIELATLYEASMAISTHWDDRGILNTLIEKAAQALKADRAFIASWHKAITNNGSVEAEYLSADIEPEKTSRLNADINLSGRETLLSMLNQQRPLFLRLNNPSLEKTERKNMEQYGCLSKLLIPLVTKGETIGWVELWNTRQERTFSTDEVRISRALASQIAGALQNIQYLKQTQRTLEETTALYRVASELTTLQDPQAIMSTVLQEYLQALGLKQGSVIIFDFAEKCGIVKVHSQDDTSVNTIAGHNGKSQSQIHKVLEGQQIPLQNNPVYEQLMRTRQPVIIDNPKAEWVTSTKRSASGPKLPPTGGWADDTALAILIIPIRIREEIIGVLVAENTHNSLPFDKWAISLGQAMTDQLGIGLQNVELYELEYQRREQAETLREVSSVVGSSLRLNEVLERILDQLARVIKYDSAAIHLIEGKHRRVIAGRGFKNPKEHIGLIFPILAEADEPGSIAISTRQALVYDDISEVNESFKEPRHQHIRSWIGIPLIARDKVIGLISIDHKEVGAYTEEDVHLAQAFANQVAIALENARLYNLEVHELERELDVAQEIQETLLPQFIPQVTGLDIAGRIVPARQVGGDFFHFFSTSPDQLGVAIGDVSGKGIPAALYMAAGITAIDIQTGPDVMPGELLNKLNRKLYNRLQENRMNIALQVATFIPLPYPDNVEDTEKARGSIMTVASAGMIAPIGATEHGCRFLPVSGFPIGALPATQHEYMDEVFLLDPFTTIIFSSDGIVEAQNEDGQLFGFERLEKTIIDIVGTRDAAVIAEHIVDTAQEFMGRAEQHDDMTVVVVVKK